MKAISTPTPIENDEFWRHHNQTYKTTGLTRKNYCRQNQLNYDRFGYWIKKQLRSKNQSTKLVSIKVKPESQPAAMQSILCTLNLNGGYCLRIYDINALSVILDRMS